MNKQHILIILLLLLSLVPAGTAADEGQYYPMDGIHITPRHEPIENNPDDTRPLVEKTGDPPLKDSLHRTIITAYSQIFGFPPALITELVSILYLLLGGGALTALIIHRTQTRHKNPRTQTIYSLIQKKPGITVAEIQEHTGYSRGSINYCLTRLTLADRIKKIPLKKTNHYYHIEDKEDRSLEFMKHLIQQERPQKIFRTIMNTPGITQKELAETTDIPTTTLQWHLTQLAKYEAIK
ncbi:MAG TPA: winged helix-turn-helix domain-containing protein, partial [Methanocorpusculum sp.]|nr:winged helix-turn-helix domain-containing protein [Methanocorpusculum sp.]